MMHKKKPSEEEIAMTENWGTWSKEPSEFPWSYSDRETCLILEGKATVTAPDGQSIRLPPPAVTTAYLRENNKKIPFCPGYGEHTRPVLLEAGVSEDQVEDLQRRGVVISTSRDA